MSKDRGLLTVNVKETATQEGDFATQGTDGGFESTQVSELLRLTNTY